MRSAVQRRKTSIVATFDAAGSHLEGSLSAAQFFAAMRKLETSLSSEETKALFLALRLPGEDRVSVGSILQGLQGTQGVVGGGAAGAGLGDIADDDLLAMFRCQVPLRERVRVCVCCVRRVRVRVCWRLR